MQAIKKDLGAQLNATKTQQQTSRNGMARVEGLKRYATGIDVDDAQLSIAGAKQRIESTEAALERIELELKAARNGVYLQNDVPFLQQRTSDLASRGPQTKASLAETESLLTAINEHLTLEQERIDHLSASTVSAPVSGIIWVRIRETLAREFSRTRRSTRSLMKAQFSSKRFWHQRHSQWGQDSRGIGPSSS